MTFISGVFVIVSQKRLKIWPGLLLTTDRILHMGYRFVGLPVLMALNDLERL